MFKHLFKLIWNKKKQNFLLICEMLISFMVMFAVFTMIVNYYRNYNTPMGFTYENVWAVNFNNNKQFKSADSSATYYELLRKTLKALPQVQEVSYAGSNIPFANSTSITGFKYKGVDLPNVNIYQAEKEYSGVFEMKVLEGRWFNNDDRATAIRPVIINQTLKTTLVGNGKVVGQIFDSANPEENNNKMRVIGVVADMKDKGDFYLSGKAMFQRIDTGFYQYMSTMVIKLTPDADAAFESKLYKTLTNYMKDASIEIEHMDYKRERMNQATLIPVIVFLTIAGFLIINVALGLFGVLWYNINKRKGEIGLRRAIGASANAVSGQIVAEAMILATMSMAIGTFFAIQFPLLNALDLAAGVYITAIILSIIFIYLLVLICSLYPGRQAAAIYPAVALHEE